MDVGNTAGRGWRAEELRLKSFKDLHTLWYILLRERNLLASQKEEVRRMGVENEQFQVNSTRVYHVGFSFLPSYCHSRAESRIAGSKVNGTYQTSHQRASNRV
jgi:hypothetical protein